MHRYVDNRRGAALIIVLIAFTVMFVFGVSALYMSGNSLHQVKDDRSEAKARFLAESGLDAALEYLNSTTGAFVSETMPMVYFDKSANQFVTTTPSAQNLLGSVQTTVAYNATSGICTVTAVAQAGGETYTAQAQSNRIVYETVGNAVPTSSLYSTNRWYYCRYTSPPATRRYLFSGNPANVVTMRDSRGDTRIVSYHYMDGVAVFQTPTNSTFPLELARQESSEAHRRVGYGANTIFFNCPVHLHSGNNSYDPGFVVLSAETIVFQQALHITRDTVWGNTFSTGVPILSLPDGKGFSGEVVYQNVPVGERPKVNLNAKYGKIYFVGDVLISTNGGSSRTRSNDLSGRAFYYRMDPALPESGLPIEYYDSDGNDYRYAQLYSRGLLIPAASSVPPTPTDLVEFKIVQ